MVLQESPRIAIKILKGYYERVQGQLQGFSKDTTKTLQVNLQGFARDTTK